ncbi:S1 RNA-binding domain-containing protein 1 isoform X2 [Hyalella azteca]|uniref:S1 RNA-binding domain-containing protein 1 isoform X2 n=1 Tax=Hyalella azteca TaxID=294128 RepID=A0A8B7NEV6_HYAAZ|nr:S1 RNA-binding domain-containing protein 1 isoform X2 [Hyalella azteca]
MDSVPDIDDTINLDDSEWLPPTTKKGAMVVPDDDYVEIVGEYVPPRPQRRSARTAHAQVLDVPLIGECKQLDGPDEASTPNRIFPKDELGTTCASTRNSKKLKKKFLQKQSISKGSRSIIASGNKKNIMKTFMNKSSAKFRGPPLGHENSENNKKHVLKRSTGKRLAITNSLKNMESSEVNKTSGSSRQPTESEDFLPLSSGAPLKLRRPRHVASNELMEFIPVAPVKLKRSKLVKHEDSVCLDSQVPVKRKLKSTDKTTVTKKLKLPDEAFEHSDDLKTGHYLKEFDNNDGSSSSRLLKIANKLPIIDALKHEHECDGDDSPEMHLCKMEPATENKPTNVRTELKTYKTEPVGETGDYGSKSEACSQKNELVISESAGGSRPHTQRSCLYNRGRGPYYQGHRPYNEGSMSYHQESGPHNQNSGPYSQGSGPYNQDSGPYNQDSWPYNQESRPHNLASGLYNRGSGPFNKGSGSYIRGSGSYNRGSGPFNQGSGPFNQGSGPFNHGNWPHNNGRCHFNESVSFYNESHPPSRGIGVSTRAKAPIASKYKEALPELETSNAEFSIMSLDMSTSSEFSPAKAKSFSSCAIQKSDIPGAESSKQSSSCEKQSVKKTKSPTNISCDWDPAQVISTRKGIDVNHAREIIRLVDQECTLPFIARYRREKTGDLEIGKLREVLSSYEQLKEVKLKVSKIVSDQKKPLEPEIKESLLKATSLQEVKILSASLRTTGKGTFADRARKAGLAPTAEELLRNRDAVAVRDELQKLVVPGMQGRSTIDDVESGIKYIIADIISKNAKMLEEMKTWLKRSSVKLVSSRARKVLSKLKKSPLKPKKVVAKRKSLGGTAATKKGDSALSPDVIRKYEQYFEFSMVAWRVAPHAICAINRGEQQGVLNVKVVLPDEAYHRFCSHVQRNFLGSTNRNLGHGYGESYGVRVLLDTQQDCWDRLVSPSLKLWVRSELSDTAELASIEVFVTNVRHLLLTPPVRANTVLAIDPGFAKGCKVAVVERKGRVLAVDTIFPFAAPRSEAAAQTLVRLASEYHCEVIAIGNGTACRETEAWLSKLISEEAFGALNVQYTIINESGASQYSITNEASAEFPGMDINHISAVSLARRLQDPLLEYVKVPPVHLGVGMYQRDVNKKLLDTALDSVVMECVSFVGVDINVASELILRKVSGLNKARASAIVKYREDVGPFRNREEIKKVKGIGPVSFQQCAGFVKIVPQTLRQRAKSNLAPLCPLDSTTVHPESYESAKSLISLASLDINNIGDHEFIHALKNFMTRHSLLEIREKCNCSESSLKTVLESLYQPLDFDFRAQFHKPIFRKGVTNMADLKTGQRLTGSVRNVTTFGVFVDIGVGQDGLIHTHNLNGTRLHVGNVVQVSVINVNISRGHIGLKLITIVS